MAPAALHRDDQRDYMDQGSREEGRDLGCSIKGVSVGRG